MNQNLNDSLDALFTGDTGAVRTAPVRQGAVEFKSAEQLFEENCSKCRGTGKFVSWGGRTTGQCFACKGAGKNVFKTSPETRAKARDQKASRELNKAEQAFADFAAQNKAVAEWIEAKRGSFDFAAKMFDSVVRFGSLTQGQSDAVQRMIDRDAAKVSQCAEATQNAPQVDTAGIDRLKLAFDKAKAYAAAKATGLTIKNPKITIGGMTISPAKEHSKNPGALYVKASGTYLGKITNGRFFADPACDDARKAQVLQFVADPAQAAKAYGQETGVCCVCNATLRSAWRLRGIGPVCAEKMGWAGLAEDYGGPNPPPRYVRDAHSWCIERARAERRQWLQHRGLPTEEACVPFNSYAPDTNE